MAKVACKQLLKESTCGSKQHHRKKISFSSPQTCDCIEIVRAKPHEKFLGLWRKHESYGTFTLVQQIWANLNETIQARSKQRCYKSVFHIKGTGHLAESSRGSLSSRLLSSTGVKLNFKLKKNIFNFNFTDLSLTYQWKEEKKVGFSEIRKKKFFEQKKKLESEEAEKSAVVDETEPLLKLSTQNKRSNKL